MKLAKNCCRAYAANDIEEEDEPKDDTRMSITMEEFLRLLRRTFAQRSKEPLSLSLANLPSIFDFLARMMMPRRTVSN